MLLHPPIVFLDEPSTGMDPESTGRAVILTTHSMEECEALCQRIGIMVSGRLKCVGSAQHLRSRYGNGYQLDVNVAIEKVDAMVNWVAGNFPGSALLESYDRNLKFQIPRTADKSLGMCRAPLSLLFPSPVSRVSSLFLFSFCSVGAIFRLIQESRAALSIAEYSVSEATLEQIFLRFARTQEEELADPSAAANVGGGGPRSPKGSVTAKAPLGMLPPPSQEVKQQRA